MTPPAEAAVEPVADLIAKLQARAETRAATSKPFPPETFLEWRAAASLSQLSTKLENAEREMVDKADAWDMLAKKSATIAELRAKLAEARAAAFEEAAQIAESFGRWSGFKSPELDAAHNALVSSIVRDIRARAVKGAGQS